MKILVAALAVIAITGATRGSDAKTFNLQNAPKTIELQYGDDFSVHCQKNNTNIIDEESVDVDAKTVTVQIQGTAPVVHPITNYTMKGENVPDRSGKLVLEFYLEGVQWGATPQAPVGLMLDEDRWNSHHEDNTYWTCDYVY